MSATMLFGWIVVAIYAVINVILLSWFYWNLHKIKKELNEEL